MPGLRRWRGADSAAKGEIALVSGLAQGGQEEPPEAPTENLHREEEVGATGDPPGAVRCEAPSREDTVEMRVMVELLAPGMQDGEAADLCAEMLRVPARCPGAFGRACERAAHRARAGSGAPGG